MLFMALETPTKQPVDQCLTANSESFRIFKRNFFNLPSRYIFCIPVFVYYNSIHIQMAEHADYC